MRFGRLQRHGSLLSSMNTVTYFDPESRHDCHKDHSKYIQLEMDKSKYHDMSGDMYGFFLEFVFI